MNSKFSKVLITLVAEGKISETKAFKAFVEQYPAQGSGAIGEIQPTEAIKDFVTKFFKRRSKVSDTQVEAKFKSFIAAQDVAVKKMVNSIGEYQ